MRHRLPCLLRRNMQPPMVIPLHCCVELPPQFSHETRFGSQNAGSPLWHRRCTHQWPMPTRNGTPLPVAKPDVVYRALPDGAVLFSIQDEVYYGLNTVGAFLWEALPPINSTVEDLCAHLQARYSDVDPAVLRSDVEEILAELKEFGLVTEDHSTSVR
jgi:hypothetical protein